MMRGILISMMLLFAATAVSAGGADVAAETPVQVPDFVDRVLPEPAIPFLQDPMTHIAFVEKMQNEGYVAAMSDSEYEGIRHSFGAFGDADKDGRDDILHAYGEDDDDEMMLELISGYDTSDVIWSMELDEDDDEYYYIVRDSTGDGLKDIVRVEELSERNNQDTYEATIEFALLDGRNLELVWTLEASARAKFTYESALPLIGIAGYTYNFEADIPMLTNLDDRQGMDLVTIHMRDEMEQSGVPLASQYSSHYTFGSTVTKVFEGELNWSAGSPDLLLFDLGTDVNGDDIPDMLFGSKEYTFHFDTTPLVGGSEEEEADMNVAAFSGLDGAALWSTSIPEAAESGWADWSGNLYGDGPTVTVERSWFYTTQTLFMYDWNFGSEVRFLDGATGDARASKTFDEAFAFTVRLGDANEDGLDELYLLKIGMGGAQIGAITGEFQSLWKENIDGGVFIAELNGDGLNDLVMLDDEDLEVLSGADGETLWEAEFDDLADVNVITDLNKDGGSELAIATFEDLDDDDGLGMGHLYLLSGADGTGIWNKQVFDPANYAEDIFAERVNVYLGNLGKLTADSVVDPAIYMYGTDDYSWDCSGGRCEREYEHDMPRLDFVSVVNGATGKQLLRYDHMPLAVELSEVPDVSADLGPAGIQLQSKLDEEAPGAPVVFVGLAMLAVALYVRRR